MLKDTLRYVLRSQHVSTFARHNAGNLSGVHLCSCGHADGIEKGGDGASDMHEAHLEFVVQETCAKLKIRPEHVSGEPL